jgi:diguanylate cyclase (GGDEF)-like protein
VLWSGLAAFLLLWIASFALALRYQDLLSVSIAAGVSLVALGSAFVMWILRHTARPLEELARLASADASFPEPTEAAGVREVDALAWALHELDLAVRDREERLAEAHREAVELSRFGEHVQQLVDEDELHEALTSRLIAVSDAHGAVSLVRGDTSGLAVARSTGTPAERLELPILAEPGRCRAVRTLKPVICDGGTPTACKCELVPAAGSSLCTPMVTAGELVGVVSLQATWRAHFTDRIQSRVAASLGFGATALASLRLLAATRERALRDPLTGAYNRAFLGEFLAKQLASAGRRGVGIGVLAVDLDHFKALNDNHGHAAGDRALIAVVQAIQGEVRSGDAVVRHGGEELIVVLADTDLRGATDAAERIRRAIEGVAIATERGPVPVRASLGVSAFPDHGDDQADLLLAADRALYQAKEQGRNRVVTAAPGATAVRDVPSMLDE